MAIGCFFSSWQWPFFVLINLILFRSMLSFHRNSISIMNPWYLYNSSYASLFLKIKSLPWTEYRHLSFRTWLSLRLNYDSASSPNVGFIWDNTPFSWVSSNVWHCRRRWAYRRATSSPDPPRRLGWRIDVAANSPCPTSSIPLHEMPPAARSGNAVLYEVGLPTIFKK